MRSRHTPGQAIGVTKVGLDDHASHTEVRNTLHDRSPAVTRDATTSGTVSIQKRRRK